MKIVVCPMYAIDAVIDEHGPSHIISLIGPETAPPPCPGAPTASRLHLPFNDIFEPAEGLVCPSEEHVERLIAFGRSWERALPVVIHCWAGVSRSTAAAYILACDRIGPGAEADLARRLRQSSATAWPNRRMIALADLALGRGGAMVEGINAIGRGLEAPAGAKPFEYRFD